MRNICVYQDFLEEAHRALREDVLQKKSIPTR